MAEISDLTSDEQQTIIDYDFNDLFERLFNVLSRVHSANDAEIVETQYVKDELLKLETIILACGNTAGVTADAILNP